jgi:hypothetical protein
VNGSELEMDGSGVWKDESVMGGGDDYDEVDSSREV